MADGIRIAMWSGPRNLSTALMRSFGNRTDTDVADEPFYGAYLAITGLDHPMREDILDAMPTDWRDCAAACAAPVSPGRIHYQKHMTQHMLPTIGRDWMDACRHAFLIRDPVRVVASFGAKWDGFGLKDIGFAEQADLFDRMADRTGTAPPVIDAADIRAAPGPSLSALCAALGISFDPAMLSWPPGRRASDGVWAAHWYGAVETSTGFAPPEGPPAVLEGPAARIAEAARPFYDHLRVHALRPAT
jgi:hypothetical protein